MFAQAAVVSMYAMKYYRVGKDEISQSEFAAGIHAMASHTGVWQVDTTLVL
jgi:hypothetical protein